MSKRNSSASSTPTGKSSKADETVYIGESNLLTLVASKDGRSASSTNQPCTESNLTYTIPEDHNAPTSRMSLGTSCSKNAIDFLNREGAFVFPEAQVTATLLKAYFKWFHPAFAVLDKSTMSRDYHANSIPPLLLHAMLFIGSSYSSDEYLLSAGFTSRYDARLHFYSRAKLLYDLGWEADKTTIIQTLFLISFWRSDASNDKDTRHWLGAAISLAQNRGYHRSLVYEN